MTLSSDNHPMDISCPPTPSRQQNQTCGSCPNAHECRDVWSKDNTGPFNSAGLILSSITAFLMPILLAIITGGIASIYLPQPASPWLIILACVAGLVLGALLAWMLVSRMEKWFGRKTPGDGQLQ